MRILIATHNYPRFSGDPAGAFVARLARAACAAGHDVHVVAPHAPGAASMETPAPSVSGTRVTVERFRYAPERMEIVAYRGDLHRHSPVSPLMLFGLPAFLLAFRRSLVRAKRRFQPHVVHAHWWFPAGWLSSGLRLPLVVTCHGSDVRLLERRRLARRMAAGALSRASHITTVSKFLARSLGEALPACASRTSVAPMPVDVERFARGREERRLDPPRILYAGNLLASKGVSDLITAFAILRERGLKCTLKILGEGPELDALVRKSAELRVGADVEWSGFVSQDMMPAEYGASTVTVLPTRGRDEGLGLTLVEALLAGCAVVGTRVGGIQEVVLHEETGLLARDGDPYDLASKIQRLLEDPRLRAQLISRGQARAEEIFAVDRCAARFLALYQSAVRHA